MEKTVKDKTVKEIESLITMLEDYKNRAQEIVDSADQKIKDLNKD